MKTFFEDATYKVGSKNHKEVTQNFNELKEAQAYAKELERKYKQRSFIYRNITLSYDY